MVRITTPLALAVLVVGVTGHAATFEVDRTDDTVAPAAITCTAAANDCSLRGAVLKANATPGADTIHVPAGTYALTIPATDFEDDAANGDLDVNADLTLTGDGADTTIIQFCATAPGTCPGIDRVLDVGPKTPGITVTISGVTIRNGHKDSFADHVGGGIRNAATLTIMNSVVTGNSAANGGGFSYGGGISNGGTLMLIGTTVSHNASAGLGGGIVCQDGSVLTVTASTISDNTSTLGAGGVYAGFFDTTGKPTLSFTDSTVSGNDGGSGNGVGGGVNLNRGTLTMRRCTISGNSVEGQSTGGGLAVIQGTTTLENCTISGNQAGSGGGITNTGGSVVSMLNCTVTGNQARGVVAAETAIGGGLAGGFRLANTIVAGNSTVGVDPDCAGTMTSAGYNLIQNLDGCTVGGDATGNVTGVAAGLDALADNGGPTTPHTFTHALLPGSPAINAGNPATPGSGDACAATDQRGVPRPQPAGQRCDIGAVEEMHPVTTTTGITSTTSTSTSTRPSTTIVGASTSTTSTISTTGSTTTTLAAQEICGDCIDNDGNGLTDFEDPACCSGAGVLTLTLKQGRIKPVGAASRLKLSTLLASAAGVDPTKQDVYVQLRESGGAELLCAKLPASAIVKKGKGYRFADPTHQVATADGVDQLRLQVTKKGAGKLTTVARQAQFRSPGAATLDLTFGFRDAAATSDSANRCATSAQPFKANKKGALRFP